MIKKIKGQYVVMAETTSRVFGRYQTKAEAEKRLKQIEFFKHLAENKSPGKPKSK